VKKTYLWIATIVALELLGAWLFITHAKADEPFTLQPPTCYFNALDYRYELADPYDAIVWWCDGPTGLEENYRTGELGGIREFLFRISAAGKDLWQADRLIFVRASNDRELTLVSKIDASAEPRCVFSGTAKTTQVLSATMDRTIGPARTDGAGKVIRWSTAPDRPSCWSWIVEGTKRWCSVTGLLDTAGREIGPDSYVACKLVTAPVEGRAK
jgi:hypothetical protein